MAKAYGTIRITTKDRTIQDAVWNVCELVADNTDFDIEIDMEYIDDEGEVA